jgi:hypothetical protein
MTIKSGLETPLNKMSTLIHLQNKIIIDSYACALLEFHLLDFNVILLRFCSCHGGGGGL